MLCPAPGLDRLIIEISARLVKKRAALNPVGAKPLFTIKGRWPTTNDRKPRFC